jgi:hypothetical protein
LGFAEWRHGRSTNPQAPASDDHEIRVIVHEVGTGHEHCFRIDLDPGEAIPCG